MAILVNKTSGDPMGDFMTGDVHFNYLRTIGAKLAIDLMII